MDTPWRGHALPVLVRAALTHVQFETIHPFLDGKWPNWAAAIVLMLIDAEVLQLHFSYLSLFFKQHRSRYYDYSMAGARTATGRAWIDFFLEGVESTADQTL